MMQRRAEKPTAAETMNYIAKSNATEADVARAQGYVGRLVTLQVEEMDAKVLKHPPRYRCQAAFLDDLNRLMMVLVKEDEYESRSRAQFGGGAAAIGM